MNPWEWLREWCNDDDRRSAELDTDDDGHPRVQLDYRISASSFSQFVTGIGATYDEAVLAARDALPIEVRR